jgi:voltage-gated potassium channel
LTGRWREALRELYLGTGRAAAVFQWLLLGFDIVLLGYFTGVALHPLHPTHAAIELGLGVLLALDAAARAVISPRPVHHLLRPAALIDLIVFLSLVVPSVSGNLGFLRVLRSLRILRSYHVLGLLRRRSPWVHANEEVLRAAVNLGAFVFVVSAVVYVSQSGRNAEIASYVDALYFTVATLTTTGFGDVTLEGDEGRLVSVTIMIAGISLFLRLAQAVFRPGKVRHPCPHCGLQRHDIDAVHCKACGRLLTIPDEGM